MNIIVKKLSTLDTEVLADFFSSNSGSDFFDPFELNRESAVKILNESGKNLYYGWYEGENMVGFGMLRWYKNFSSPTLGLLVDKSYRGQGIGNKIYLWLFAAAKDTGCLDIISIVDKKNYASIHIAEKLGMHSIQANKLKVFGRYDFDEYAKKHSNKIIFKKKLFPNIAPILVTVYNRPIHFRTCIESLKKNTFAQQTHLFIAIDFPSKEDHKLNHGLVVEYARSIVGFKEVTLILRKKNVGALENIFSGFNEVFEKYDRLIFFEDDNYFSEDFLPFVNKGLDFYKDFKNVFSISGYNYPINDLKNDNEVYVRQWFSAWGVGVWKHKWESILWDEQNILNETRGFLKSYVNVIKYNKIANHLIPNLITMIGENYIHIDSYLSLYQFQNNIYSIFPKVSRVRNLGNDNSGLHCGSDDADIFSSQEIYQGDGLYTFPQKIVEQKEINELLSKYFKKNAWSKFKTLIKLLLVNFGIIYKK